VVMVFFSLSFTYALLAYQTYVYGPDISLMIIFTFFAWVIIMFTLARIGGADLTFQVNI
jgi:Flp pilus assembly protein protease CpaA